MTRTVAAPVGGYLCAVSSLQDTAGGKFTHGLDPEAVEVLFSGPSPAPGFPEPHPDHAARSDLALHEQRHSTGAAGQYGVGMFDQDGGPGRCAADGVVPVDAGHIFPERDVVLWIRCQAEHRVIGAGAAHTNLPFAGPCAASPCGW